MFKFAIEIYNFNIRFRCTILHILKIATLHNDESNTQEY